MAGADFRQLQKLWSHANVSLKDKLRFFESLVVSRLAYGLSTLCLATAQRRRLDGFYCRCLRRILRIPSAYLSRVSNSKVLQKAGTIPFSTPLLHRQVTLLRKIVKSPAGSTLRNSIFIDDSLSPQVGRYVRRVGRPRQDWFTQVTRDGAIGLTSLSQLSMHRPV